MYRSDEKKRSVILCAALILAAGLIALAHNALAYMDDLPKLDVYRMSKEQSSYDRDGGNNDNTEFLYSDATGKVMLDVQGPGRVNSIWCTGFDMNARLKVYFDGETSPTISIPLRDLFSGTYTGYNGQFKSPLVGNNLEYSGGFLCYVPLPFSKSIKISTSAANISYHNIRYETYPAGTPIATWTPNQDNSAMIKAWSNPTEDPKTSVTVRTISNTIDLDPNTSTTIMDLAGPRSIVSLKMKIPNLDRDILNNTRIQATWDNAQERAIDAPLGAFFGAGAFGPAQVRALPLGMTSETLYMYLPMPFEKHSRIVLQNNRTTATSSIWYEIQHKDFPESFANVGNLKTKYTVQEGLGDDHKDLIFLDTTGSGKLVGIVDSRSRFLQWIWGINYLEGDDRIYIDGNRSPQWHGTGTEDFYNGAWYFEQGPYTRPTSGHTIHIQELPAPKWDTWDYLAMYRMFVEESIPFRKSIRFGLEHGFGWGGDGFLGDVACTAETLVFYYHKPEARMTLCDTIDVGDAESESSHSYKVSDQTWSGSLAFTYEGDDDATTITDTGRAFTGSSEFTIKNLPATNEGVVLRRRLDYGIANQAADVYVDGELVGRWYTAGTNWSTHRWRDSDFMIPAANTSGKAQIKVKIQFVSSAQDWNEFLYEAYALGNENQLAKVSDWDSFRDEAYVLND